MINPLLNSLPTGPAATVSVTAGRLSCAPNWVLCRTFLDFLLFQLAVQIFRRKNDEKMEKSKILASQKTPKTVPKSIRNRGSRNHAKFHRFCSNFVACCKSQTSKFVRPANVLLTFHTMQLFACSTYFGSEKPTKNPSKTTSEPLKNLC